jgi:hypothetical protein
MKRTFIILLIGLLTALITFGQTVTIESTNQSHELFDYHMLKSKQAKTTGWIMLGAGIGMTIAGLGINTSGGIVDGDSTNNDEGLWLSYLGAATTVASIPFFISAGKNKRKAQMFLKNSVSSQYSPDFKPVNYTSISIIVQL